MYVSPKMKCFLIVFLIAVSSKVNAGDSWGDFADLFSKVTNVLLVDQSFKPYLEKIKPMLKTGNDTLKIPLVDPYTEDSQKINTTNDNGVVRADGNLTNIEIFGLSDYIVNSATYNTAGMKGKSNLTWPKIVMNSSYDLDAKFFRPFNLPFYGRGRMTLELYNLTLDMTVWLDLKDGKVFVKSMATNVTLDENYFFANGVYYGDFYSVIISDYLTTAFIPNIVDNHPAVVIDPFNEKMTEALNKHIQDATLQDLLNIIGVSIS